MGEEKGSASFLGQMFSEAGGVSSTRVAMLLCVFTACVIGVIAMFQNKDLTAVAILVGAFLGPAILGKVAQKKFENEPEK